MKRNLIAIGALIILLGVTLYVNFGQGARTADESMDQAALETKAQKGYLAPDFTIASMEGEEIRLSELRGEPVFINFWASWCEPCKEEMPHLLEAYKKYGSEINFVMINVIEQEFNKESMNKYIKEAGLTFPIYLDKKDNVSTLYNILGYPTSFFINKDGVIQEIVMRPMSSEMIVQLMNQLLDR